MNGGIAFSGLWPWILMALIVALLAGILLYRRDHSLDIMPGQRWIRLLLISLRSLAIALVLLLLINPLIRDAVRRVEKPILVLAFDASASIVQSKDSLAILKQLNDFAQSSRERLSDKFDLQFFSFGSGFRNLEETFSATELQTDISEVFEQSKLRYEGKNIRSIVLLSDGLYNKGQNPVYIENTLGVPIHTVGIGDSSVRRDLRIQAIRSNEMVYSGNRFPVEIDIESRKIPSGISTLSITHNGTVVHTEQIRIDNETFNARIQANLEAKGTGNQRFVVRLSPVGSESTLLNNSREFFIDVLEARQKLLLLSMYPSPDIGAFKRAIERNSNYELEVKMGSIDPKKISTERYDLVMVYGWGNAPEHRGLLKTFNEHKQHWLGIVAVQPSLATLNALGSGIQISGINNSYNESRPIWNPNFAHFELDKELLSRLQMLPPMVSPYGNYQSEQPTGIMLAQKIGSVNTQYPLFYLHNSADMRHGLILGEGFWKWQLNEFERYGDFKLTDELLGKTVQFLTKKNDRRPFRVQPLKRILNENESIRFRAEVYDKNYEPITTPEVNMALSNTEGKKYTYSFTRRDKSYELNAGQLPAGTYTYTASVQNGGQRLTEQGSVVVRKLEAEFMDQSANFNALRSISAASGAEFKLLSEAEALIDLLEENEDMSAVSYTEMRLSELISWRWILFLIVALLGLEWSLRRWLGGY